MFKNKHAIYELVPCEIIPKYDREWIETLQPGDPVIVIQANHNLDKLVAIETTVREVTLTEVRINPFGTYEKKNGEAFYGGGSLKPPTPDLVACARKIRRKDAHAALKKALEACKEADLGVMAGGTAVDFYGIPNGRDITPHHNIATYPILDCP